MNEKKRKLFISVGEESADLHASKLCARLRELNPEIEIAGFGGEKMKTAGVDIIYPLPELALIGFVEVVKHLPLIIRLKKQAIQFWETQKPDAIVLVDYPGFNFRLAHEAHRRNIPVLYYIAPQAWAWREKRVETMREIIDRLFVIFPFEESFFQNRGVETTYTGHPLIERITPPDDPLTLDENIFKEPCIGLLPGSRKNELRSVLPTLLEAAVNLRQQRPDACFLLPLADPISESFLDRFEIPSWIEVCRDSGYSRRREMSFAWTASGTATVENALLGIPMAVVFKTNRVNMYIGRRLVRIPYIGMVNLIAQKGICPEFIQEQCQPETLAQYADELLSSPQRYVEMKNDFAHVRERIGQEPASLRAAQAILQSLESIR